jgi:hypothetical protein
MRTHRIHLPLGGQAKIGVKRFFSFRYESESAVRLRTGLEWGQAVNGTGDRTLQRVRP